MLVSEGHSILRRPEHGPHEHGKDIISRDPEGKINAFQLKAGDIATAEWRQISGEINDLVEAPINDPQTGLIVEFYPTLVTSGRISEPVRHKITLNNQGWVLRGRRPLKTVEGDALLARFRAAQGSFLPSELKHFNLFLKLFLADGTHVLDVGSFCQFLESFLPLGRPLRPSEQRAAFASAPIFADMVFANFSRASNHFAEATGWIVVIAYLLALADGGKWHFDWRITVEIATDSWCHAMELLLAEALENHNWLAGNTLVDEGFVRYRKQLVLGVLSAYMLFWRCRGAKHRLEDDLFLRVIRDFEATPFFGEGLAPALYSCIVLLRLRGEELMAVKLAAEIVQFVSRPPEAEFPHGVPDPYHPFEEIESQRLFPAPESPMESFEGHSYCARQFVEFVARQNWRRDLKRVWFLLTENQYIEFVPRPPSGFYRWHCAHGVAVSRQWGRPQQWDDLAKRASLADRPELLIFTDYPGLLLPFAIALPHRFTPAVARHAEFCADAGAETGTRSGQGQPVAATRV